MADCVLGEMKKIIHISQAGAGGVPAYLSLFVGEMDQSRFSNLLICSGGYKEEWFSGSNMAIEKVDMCREINLSKDFKAIKEIRAILKRENPDIVYCNSSKAGALGRIAAMGLGLNVVYNAHGWAFNMKTSFLYRLVYIIIESVLAFFCDKIICISKYEKQSALAKFVGTNRKDVVIYNGIEIERVESAKKNPRFKKTDFGIPEDDFVVGMIGRMSKQKAPDDFVRMAAEIHSKMPNTHFFIIGNGKEQEAVEELIKSLGLKGCFHLTGWVENKYDYLALFDVGVLLSRWEGFGLAIAEYMAAGIPSVVTNVDAIPELVTDGENGLLVGVGDYVDAAEKVTFLLNNKEAYNIMSCKAVQRVKADFSADRMTKETLALFNSLIDKKR